METIIIVHLIMIILCPHYAVRAYNYDCEWTYTTSSSTYKLAD